MQRQEELKRWRAELTARESAEHAERERRARLTPHEKSREDRPRALLVLGAFVIVLAIVGAVVAAVLLVNAQTAAQARAAGCAPENSVSPAYDRDWSALSADACPVGYVVSVKYFQLEQALGCVPGNWNSSSGPNDCPTGLSPGPNYLKVHPNEAPPSSAALLAACAEHGGLLEDPSNPAFPAGDLTYESASEILNIPASWAVFCNDGTEQKLDIRPR
jgi:hypothetical protein